ncbi:Gfo/Idh/MocA family oxidoreductase, partial [Frankia sp. AgB1.9]|uniref:Gfo/Idh/MocA family oxidoreductase n=1 Tax=unclassified Frankia TaxID=2632575 RepID=UPI0019339599
MKVVVIGTGFGTRVMAGAYEEAGFSVEAVSPRDADALSRVKAVDLVSVHAPPFLHRDYVLAALDSGAAVLCDKPFGRNADEARVMRDQA